MDIYYKQKLLQNKIFLSLFQYPEGMVDKLIIRWKEPWRFYHTLENHLYPMLDRIYKLAPSDDKDLLEIIAWFHDCVYDPRSSSNEEDSIKFFLNNKKEPLLNDHDITINNVIMQTKDFKIKLDDLLSLQFFHLDLAYLRSNSIFEIIRNEKLVLKEFQFVDYSIYKQKRIEILKSFIGHPYVNNDTIIIKICEYLENYRPSIGIYPGSFNPFHLGHLSILRQAEKLFDKVIIAMGINPEKTDKIDLQKFQDLQLMLPYHEVVCFNSFLHEYVKEKSKSCDITIIRGFRSGYDIESELVNLEFMREMSDNDIKVIFLAPQKKFDHISSSALRLMKKFDPEKIKNYISTICYPT